MRLSSPLREKPTDGQTDGPHNVYLFTTQSADFNLPMTSYLLTLNSNWDCLIFTTLPWLFDITCIDHYGQ